MEKYKKVSFLGSGFSKALCSQMPTIKDLLKNIEKDSILDKFVTETEAKLNDSFDVENCVSYILSRKIFFSDEEDIEFYTLRKQLLKHIYKIMKNFEPDTNKMDVIEKFLYYCINEEVLLVTFNYDLFIEKICDYLNKQKKMNENGHRYYLKVNYGVNLNADPYDTNKTVDFGNLADRDLQLLKLHGSFNWFNQNQTENADINDIISIDQNKIDDIYSEKIPFYVPMSNNKYKYYEGNFYKLLWKKMKYYIDNAEELDFIGYGFPKTDFDNLMLFSSYKDKIKDIVIFNSQEDLKNKKRLESIFSRAQVYTDGAMIYLNKLIKNISVTNDTH